MKIKNGIAGQAVKMVVVFPVGIKSSGISLALHNIDHLNTGKGYQGPVHRIQRDVGKTVQKLFMDTVCAGMFF